MRHTASKVRILHLLPYLLLLTESSSANSSREMTEDLVSPNIVGAPQSHNQFPSQNKNITVIQRQNIYVNGSENSHGNDRYNYNNSSSERQNLIYSNCKDNVNYNSSELLDPNYFQPRLRNIAEQNSTVTEMFQEFENATFAFINEEPTGEKAIVISRLYRQKSAQLLRDIVNLNLAVRSYKCNSKIQVRNIVELPEEEFKNQIQMNIYKLEEFEYIFNLTLIYGSILVANDNAATSVEKYNTNRNLQDLEYGLQKMRLMKELMEEYVKYLHKFHTFLGNNTIHDHYINETTEFLFDLESWANASIEKGVELEGNEKYFYEEKYRVILQEIIQPVVQGIIFVIGFIGNIVLLVIFVRVKELRTAPSMMILNLAFGDTLNLVLNIPTFYSYSTSITWTIGEGTCKAFRFFRIFGIGVSIYSVVVISVLRYSATVNHKYFCEMSIKTKVIILITIVWVVSALVATPHTIFAGIYKGNCYGSSEDIHTSYSIYITLCDFILFCIIPLSLIITFTLATAFRLKKKAKNLPGESAGITMLIKSRIVSSNVLIALTVVSAISYIPFYLFLFVYARIDYTITPNTYQTLFFVIYTLLFANSFFNPIALYISSHKFRTYFNKYLFCKKSNDKYAMEKKVSTVTTCSNLETKM